MVTLLKSEPLSYEDVQTYSAGTDAQISNQNGYGGMQYGETSHYLTSYVKATVDAWKNVNAPVATEAGLITIDEVSSLGYEWKQTCPTCGEDWVKTDEVPTWVYNSNYDYWTMTPVADSVSDIYRVADRDVFSYGGPGVRDYGYVVRPVITISKTALSN